MIPSLPLPVDFHSYAHIWCVGCSFTSYTTDTWADLLAREHPVTNLGQSGAGNQYIFQTLWELHSAGRISANDLVLVQWTSVFRDSRRYRGEWITPGNLWTQDKYPRDYISKFCDPEEFYHRDIALIGACQSAVLDRYAHHELSMCPLTQLDQYRNRQLEIDVDHSAVTGRILPSFYEVLYDNDVSKLPGDHHPTPEQHAVYLEKIFNWKASS